MAALVIVVALLVISVALIVWTYVGYPVFLAIVAVLFKKKHKVDNKFLPELTLMIMTYNEEITIAAKIKNSLALKYPKDKLEIFVVDSASTDKTQQIARKFAKSHKNVKLIAQKERKGKASGINFGIKKASGDIVMITDGNAMMNPNALKKIVRHFADPKVGGVCGRFEARNMHDTATAEGGSIYWKIENFMRKKESSIDSCIHMSGEVTALRKKIYHAVDEKSLTEDFDMAVNLRKRGYRIIYEPAAIAFEPAPTNAEDLTTQKKRIVIGTWQTLTKYKTMMFNPKYGWYGSLIMPSHKLYQICTPFFFVVLFVSTIATYLLSSNAYILYFLLIQVVAILTALISYPLTKTNIFKRMGLFVFINYFSTVNWICVLGFFDFVTNRRIVTWKKIESSRDLKGVSKR